MIKSNLILAEWVTHKLENNYITEVLPQESSEPQIRLPSLGTRRHEIIRLSKPVAFGHRNFIGLRETEAGSCPSGGQGHAHGDLKPLVCGGVGLMVASWSAHVNEYSTDLPLPVSSSP